MLPRLYQTTAAGSRSARARTHDPSTPLGSLDVHLGGPVQRRVPSRVRGHVARIIDSLAQLAWPLIAAFFVVKIGPSIRDVLRDRDVKAKGGPGGLELEVGGQPMSTQRVVDDQRKETEGLRAEVSLLAGKLSALETGLASPDEDGDDGLTTRAAASPAARTSSGTQRILWVDDAPASIAYEVAALEDRGVDVIQSRTTLDALAKLRGESPFDAVVSDMARTEDGVRHDSAGLELIAAIRAARVRVPAVIYTTAKKVELYAAAVRDAGGIGVTASSTELFELLGVNVGPLSGIRLEAEVQLLLEEASVEQLAVDRTRNGRVDMLIRWQKKTVGVEVKAWLQPPTDRVLRDVLRRLGNLVSRGELDEVWLVTLQDLQLRDSAGQGVRSYTLHELQEVLSAGQR